MENKAHGLTCKVSDQVKIVCRTPYNISEEKRGNTWWRRYSISAFVCRCGTKGSRHTASRNSSCHNNTGLIVLVYNWQKEHILPSNAIFVNRMFCRISNSSFVDIRKI